MSAAEQETLGILALVPAGFTAEGQLRRQAPPFFLLALWSARCCAAKATATPYMLHR